jgi:hypothetical protein
MERSNSKKKEEESSFRTLESFTVTSDSFAVNLEEK